MSNTSQQQAEEFDSLLFVVYGCGDELQQSCAIAQIESLLLILGVVGGGSDG